MRRLFLRRTGWAKRLLRPLIVSLFSAQFGQAGQWGAFARRLISTFDGDDYIEWTADNVVSVIIGGVVRVRVLLAAAWSNEGEIRFFSSAGAAVGSLLFSSSVLRVRNGADSDYLGTQMGALTATTGSFTTVSHSTDRGIILTNQTDSAGGGGGTLLNAPAAGNPTFWLKVSINGGTYAIPCWPG